MPRSSCEISSALDRMQFLYLAVCFLGGLLGLTRALRQVRTVTARRQLRWIAWGTAFGAGPFAFGYALPYALGVAPSIPMQLLALPLSLIPLAYASAIVRYRLMDVEVIVKRALVYAAVLSAVVAMYVVLLKVVQRMFVQGSAGHEWVIAFLATLVAVLLAPPVKDFVQTTLDRAFYRDRYDYRRALVGFARDLNSDLDLGRLSARLVSRVAETLEVDRMALMVESETDPAYASMHAYGFEDQTPPSLPKLSGIGRRLAGGHLVALDDPTAVGWFAAEEIEFWRDTGLFYFVPCISQTGATAVLALGRKHSNEPLSSEDMELLAAVAGQMATALENARLYRQLHVKALEFDRLRAFNENILESLDDGLLVVDLEDKVVRWNTALETLYGVARSAAAGRSLDNLFDGPCVEAVRAARRDSPTGAMLSRVPLHCRGAKAGHTLIVNCAVVPLRTTVTDDGATEGTVVIVEDVTSRVQFEEQLQISEKMASIGLLAAGVAHEVNTPLTGISSFTQMLLEGADPDDPKTRLLEKIERQTFRAAKIVNGLLNLSRPASSAASELGVVDLNVVIADVLGLLEHQFATHSVKLRREHSERPVMVLGIEHKLQQVFLNLFLNAKDAMPKGGWLSVRTAIDGDRGVAEVADTGSGIPERVSRPDLRPVLHDQDDEPGHRPWSVDHVRHRARARRVDRLRQPGGARDPLRPVVPPGAVAPGARVAALNAVAKAGTSMARSGSVLVIDDEEVMREILEALLGREGYRVKVASSGEEGLDLRAFDLVRRRHRRRDDAGHRRHRHARGAQEDRRRSAGGHGHGVRVGRDRDFGHEARRVRLHHQAVQERRGASSWCATPWSGGNWWRRTRRCARVFRPRRRSSRASSAAARACGRCST